MTVSQGTEINLSTIIPIRASKMVTDFTVTSGVNEKGPNPLDGQTGGNP